MLKEFKEFAMRGNVVDMAVGIIIGGAFGTIVTSLVKDVLMPPIGMMLGGVDFSNFFAVLKEGVKPGPYGALVEAQAAGAVTVNYGVWFNSIIHTNVFTTRNKYNNRRHFIKSVCKHNGSHACKSYCKR